VKSLAIVEAATAALSAAGALGLVPTPLDLVTRALGLDGPFDIVDDKLPWALRARGEALRGKLHGFTADNLLFVDSRLPVRLRRLTLAHEQGHAAGIPWHRAVSLGGYDQNLHISSNTEREAEEFAREVLFQGVGFRDDAARHALDIRVPFRLAPRWQTTIRDTVSRYVETHRDPVAYFAAEDTMQNQSDRQLVVTRSGESESFAQRVGPICNWLPNPLIFDVIDRRSGNSEWVAQIAKLGADDIQGRCAYQYAEGYCDFGINCPSERFAYQAGWCPTTVGGRVFVLLEIA